jgi:hypothetical protein
MKLLSVKEATTDRIVLAKAMKIGQIGEILNHGVYSSALLLRDYSRFVNLKNPEQTWNNPDDVTFQVRLLPVDSVVEIRVDS